MISNNKVKTFLFRVLNNGALKQEITGRVYKDQRPTNSDKEDVIITLPTNINDVFQRANAYVSIFVKDIKRESDYVENGLRLEKLTDGAIQDLDDFVNEDIHCRIDVIETLKYRELNQTEIRIRCILTINNL